MSKTEKQPDLTYVGGGAYLPGIPATDLTADEIAARGLDPADLLASGLYVEAKAKKDEPAKGKE